MRLGESFGEIMLAKSFYTKAVKTTRTVHIIIYNDDIEGTRTRGKYINCAELVYRIYLGSDISAECLTLPQYVLRSYRDTGRSRRPGIEADMNLSPFEH